MNRTGALDVVPRALLISNEAPHTGAPGAIVFCRLFRDYPVDRLLVVTNGRLPERALRLGCRYEYLPLAVDRLSRTRLWPWRPILRTLGVSSLISLSRIEDKLLDFHPDLIVTLMQDSWFYDLAARYAAAARLPLILLAHDVAHSFEPVPNWLKQRQLGRDAKVYCQARDRLCISPGMVEYHDRLFGCPGKVLLPPRSDEPVSQSPGTCSQLKYPGRLVVGYAGGLHYGYGEQLLRLLPVFRETGTCVEMFGPSPSGSLAHLKEASDVFHFNGYAATPEDAWRHLLRTCDVVIQPYLDPAGPHELQYRTHFPSKLGDCLALGLPLIITGPDYASGVAWCRQRPGIALWASERGESTIAQAFSRLRNDTELRVTLAASAQIASLEFAAPQLRQRFIDILTASVAEPAVVA